MKYIIIILIVFLQQGLSASEKIIRGKIFDFETNAPLPFANISILGKNIGTVSNSDGYFIFYIRNVSQYDTICFSYLGYETLKLHVLQLIDSIDISLHPIACELNEVLVSNKNLTAKEIVELTYQNFKSNHSSPSIKQKVFFHRFITTNLPSKKAITLLRSDVPNVNKDFFRELSNSLNCKFVDYQDALFYRYYTHDSIKLVPLKGISIDENSETESRKLLEKKIELIATKLDDWSKETKNYYKMRSGIFSIKLDTKNDVDTTSSKNSNTKGNIDTLENKELRDKNYHYIRTSTVNSEINKVIHKYTNVESENLEFINNTRKYNYKLVGLTNNNYDPAYIISFSPKKRGLFEGEMYISTSSYAILQLDYNYLEGKSSQKFHLLGLGHSVNFKKGHIIFEKGELNYFIKYINVEKDESMSVDRNICLVRKKKRTFIDKKLNEIKVSINLKVEIKNKFELLVLEREEINSNIILKISQPKFMKYKKEESYSLEFLRDGSLVAPTLELRKYRRK